MSTFLCRLLYVNCSMSSAQCSMSSAQCSMSSAQCSMSTAQCSMLTALFRDLPGHRNPPIPLTALVQPIVHSEQVVATRNNKCSYNPDLNHKLFGQLLKRFIGYMYNVVMSLDNITTTTLYM